MTAAESIVRVQSPDDVWCPIFKTGFAAGREWTEADLRTMARNGKLLAGRLTIPITAGHPVLFAAHESAQPALGTVTDLRVEDGKLWARMSKVPAYARKLARDGRYLSVSAEIVPEIRTSPSGSGLEDTGAAGPAVVGLAWLGKHRGRVKDLPSLAALYNSEPGRIVFSDAGSDEDLDSIATLDRHIATAERFEAKFSQWNEQHHPRDGKGQFAAVESMTAGQINSELDRHEKAHAALMDQMVQAGRGSEAPHEFLGKSDPLSQKIRATRERMAALRAEATRRFGPGAPPRLPHGFDAIRKLAEQSDLVERLAAAEQKFAQIRAAKARTQARLDALRKPLPLVGRRSADAALRGRIAMSERQFDALSRANANAGRRLDALRPWHEGEKAVTMATSNQKQSFRDKVDATIGENGGDVHDATLRLDTARQLIRDLQDAGEEVPDPQSYLDALQGQLKLAGSMGGWGYDRPVKSSMNAGGTGGLQPRQAVTNIFAERAHPTAPKTSADVSRAADAAVAKDPSITRHYMQRAARPALHEDMMEHFHHELAKLPSDLPDRIGRAMRAAVARAPKAHLPRYGWGA